MIELHPTAVVILAGTNDIAGNTGPSSLKMIENNLASMAELASHHHIKVILCSLALGNILALMLTLLSLSVSMDFDIKWKHYQRVKQTAWITTVTLIATIVIYLVINIPVGESKKATSW